MLSVADRIRFALVNSPRWQEMLKEIPVMKIAEAPILKPEEWEAREQQLALKWAKGLTDEIPRPIQNYLERISDV
jgi:hypothetical protein